MIKPQVQKRPVKRLFKGLAGSPLQAQDISIVSVAESQPEPLIIKRRGRPPSNGVAMTPAERKAKSRADQQVKRDDAERKNIIAGLMRIFRRQESAPRTSAAVQDIRRQRRIYLDGLKQLSLAELRLALEGKSTPDTHGRLHNERSGEGPRSGGQSEIEQIDAAIQHDASNFDDDYEQDPNLAGGFKVAPVGPGADEFDAEDSTADSAEVRTGSGKPEYQPTTVEKWIERLVGQIQFDTKRQCPYCSDQFDSAVGMGNHLEHLYATGEQERDRQLDFIEAAQEFNDKYDGLMPRLPVNPITFTPAFVHFRLIQEDMKSTRIS